MKPDVSIMIATRNRPRLLRAALTHVARQKGVSCEVVIVDDNSDFDLQKVCGEFRSPFPVKVIRLDATRGCAGARNAGFLESSADFVIQLDDDSWLIEDDAAQVLVDHLRQHPDIGALAVKVFMPWDGSPTGVGEEFPRWKRSHLADDYSFHGCAAVFRRDVVVRAGMYPAAYSYGGQEDHLGACILRLGYRIVFFGDRGVVHGYDTIVEDPKTAEIIHRNRVYSSSHLAATFLALLPFPLSITLASVRLIVAARRDRTPFLALLKRTLHVSRAVPRQPMTWRQAVAYLGLRRTVRRNMA